MKGGALIALIALLIFSVGCQYKGAFVVFHSNHSDDGRHDYGASGGVVFSDSPHFPNVPAMNFNRTDVNVRVNNSLNQSQSQNQQIPPGNGDSGSDDDGHSHGNGHGPGPGHNHGNGHGPGHNHPDD